MATFDIPIDLIALRDDLATIPNIASCKIGLEEGLCPEAYPMIRIVVTRMDFGDTFDTKRSEISLFFGVNVHAFEDDPDEDGLTRKEKADSELFRLEKLIGDKLAAHPGVAPRYVLTDRDTIKTFKVADYRIYLEHYPVHD